MTRSRTRRSARDGGTTRTYSPPVHCAVCVNVSARPRPADREVRGYQVCDEHAELVAAAPSLAAALADARRPAQGRAA